MVVHIPQGMTQTGGEVQALKERAATYSYSFELVELGSFRYRCTLVFIVSWFNIIK